jgi:hypothetical protein
VRFFVSIVLSLSAVGAPQTIQFPAPFQLGQPSIVRFVRCSLTGRAGWMGRTPGISSKRA